MAVDPATFDGGLGHLFTPDMRRWLASDVNTPGSYNYNMLPPMQRAWVNAYHAAPTPPPDPPAQQPPPPAPAAHPVAPPITHQGVTPRPVGGGPVGVETDPPASWFNTTLGGVGVHTSPAAAVTGHHPAMAYAGGADGAGAQLAEALIGLPPMPSGPGVANHHPYDPGGYLPAHPPPVHIPARPPVRRLPSPGVYYGHHPYQ